MGIWTSLHKQYNHCLSCMQIHTSKSLQIFYQLHVHITNTDFMEDIYTGNKFTGKSYRGDHLSDS